MSIVLTCNAGSSNTKLAAFDISTLECKGRIVTHSTPETMEWIRSIGASGIEAVGHRVVHGGREYLQPTLLTEAVLIKLKTYIPLAPLHQPAALHLMEEVKNLYPLVSQIACFDTAFHSTMPEIERRLPLPIWYHNEGIQRYGFHGLSYQHIADVLPEYAVANAHGRVVVAHLGGGSSACALKGLKSVASTMGFSTLDGLMMGTRCGALDAGVILHLLQQMEMKLEEVERLLYSQSGLLGVSGISAEMRMLTASDRPEACAAVELYCYLAAKHIAALIPALGGLDILVFTGGIGEFCDPVREKITSYLKWLGDFVVYVVPTDEEIVIARACQNQLEPQRLGNAPI
ncbi:MAG: acetate/propionate family kinase [Rickettsiales bacterium]